MESIPSKTVAKKPLSMLSKLLHVVQTTDALGFGFRLAQGRQEHPGENGDDRDDDEEFDKGEGGFRGTLHDHLQAERFTAGTKKPKAARRRRSPRRFAMLEARP